MVALFLVSLLEYQPNGVHHFEKLRRMHTPPRPHALTAANAHPDMHKPANTRTSYMLALVHIGTHPHAQTHAHLHKHSHALGRTPTHGPPTPVLGSLFSSSSSFLKTAKWGAQQTRHTRTRGCPGVAAILRQEGGHTGHGLRGGLGLHGGGGRRAELGAGGSHLRMKKVLGKVMSYHVRSHVDIQVTPGSHQTMFWVIGVSPQNRGLNLRFRPKRFGVRVNRAIPTKGIQRFQLEHVELLSSTPAICWA